LTDREFNSIARRARIELETMALKNLRYTIFAGVVLSLVYTVVVHSTVESVRLWSWLSALLSSYGLRYLSERALCRIEIPEQSNRWSRGFFVFRCLVLAGAVLWGVAAIFIFPANDVHKQMILVCMLLGIAAGALTSMASVVGLYRAYILVLLLPLIARFAYEGGIHGVTMLVLTGLYLTTLYVMAGKIYQSIYSSICLRLENESLLHEVFTSKCALEQVNVDLQDEIREHKEARRQLEEAQRLAAEAARIKSRFMTNMSHELKTPMTGIAGISQHLQQTPLSAEQKNLLAELDRCNSELLFLVDNLLDFTELEKAGLVLNEQIFDLQFLFDELQEIFAYKAAKKGLSLQVFPVAEGFRWLSGDGYRLKQVLFNLLDNAIKFTGDGYVKLFVAEIEVAGTASGDTLELKFCVEDSGPGIAENKHEIIFSTFFQLDDSLTRGSGGTGVGLAISKKLVELMAGRIWCESFPGQGARFCFQVPLRLAERPEERETTVPESECREGGRPGILIVDDNKLNRKLLQAILVKRDFAPHTAENGLKALEILAREQIDLIFMDIQMPVLDGLSTTRILRSLEKGEEVREIEGLKTGIHRELLNEVRQRVAGRHIIVISITANLLCGSEKEYADCGLDYNLRKPFQPEDIYRLIRYYFPSGKPGAEVSGSDGAGPKSENRDGNASMAEPKAESSPIVSKVQVEQFLREKYHFDDDSIELMVASLRDSLKSGFDEAEQALAENDLDRLGSVAHSIKGSLANVGFFELADLAHEIEDSVSADPDLPYSEMIARLKGSLAEILE